MGNETDLSSLLGRSIPISQDVLPSTTLARKAEAAENLKKHRVYNTDYSHKGWGSAKMKEAGRRSTDAPERVIEARTPKEGAQ
jgi:hypothetical protein